jgi:hypothetical protein
MSNLIENLLKFYETDPTDSFVIYGLALEYSKSDHSKAKHFFELLMNEHSNYLPTYYTAAHFYWENSELEIAKNLFEKGILLAEQQNNQKASKELKAAQMNFLFDID